MIEPLVVGLIALAAGAAVGLILLVRKIDRVEQRVSERQRNRTGSAQGAQDILGSRLDALERYAESMEERMGRFEQRLDERFRELETTLERQGERFRELEFELKRQEGDRFRELEPRPESKAKAAPYEPFRAIQDAFLRDKPASASSAVPSPPPEPNILDEQQLQDLLRQFNELARSYTPTFAREFDENWRPLKVREVEAGAFREAEDGNLWLVPLEERHQRWVLLPSGDAVRRWEMHYRAMSGMQARELLKSSYRLQEGTAPIVISPALCSSPEVGYYRLVQQGQMKGL